MTYSVKIIFFYFSHWRGYFMPLALFFFSKLLFAFSVKPQRKNIVHYHNELKLHKCEIQLYKLFISQSHTCDRPSHCQDDHLISCDVFLTHIDRAQLFRLINLVMADQLLPCLHLTHLAMASDCHCLHRSLIWSQLISYWDNMAYAWTGNPKKRLKLQPGHLTRAFDQPGHCQYDQVIKPGWPAAT